jgi:hypothetical protein
LSAAHLGKHERRCTANPNRECGICETLQGASQNIGEIVEELKKRFEILLVNPNEWSDGEEVCKWIGEPVTIEALVEDCPNCTLAILRQSKLNYKCCGIEFDYPKEFKETMSLVTEHNNRGNDAAYW